MACRLVGAKPLSEPMLEYCWLHPGEQTFRNFDMLVHENGFESVVCEMAANCFGLNELTYEIIRKLLNCQ